MFVITKKDIVAIVVLYNPDNQVYKTIAGYKGLVSRVILVDNSSKNNQGLFKDLSYVKYIPLLDNFGIAYALNKGIKESYEKYFNLDFIHMEPILGRWFLSISSDTFDHLSSLPKKERRKQKRDPSLLPRSPSCVFPAFYCHHHPGLYRRRCLLACLMAFTNDPADCPCCLRLSPEAQDKNHKRSASAGLLCYHCLLR